MNKRTQKKEKNNRKFKEKHHQNQQQDNQDLQNYQNYQDENKLPSNQYLFNMPVPNQEKLINEIAQKLIVSPQTNIKHISTLLTLVKSNSVIISNLALDTLSTIFSSINNLSPINVEEHENKLKYKLKKEEYQVINYEINLVNFYKRYVQLLKELNRTLKKQSFQSIQLYKTFKKTIINSTCRCFTALWSFNYYKILIQIMGKNIKSEQVLQVFSQFLFDKNPALLQIKINILKIISNIIFTKPQSKLPQNLIKIMNSTFINTKYLNKDHDSQKYKQKLSKKKYYREKQLEKKKDRERDPLQVKKQRKEMKKMQKSKAKQEVEKQFAEGQYQQNTKLLVKQNSQILQQLFYVYFKIIMRRSYSVFLKDTLNGILKYAHLINTQLIKSLIENLNNSANIFRQMWQNTKDIKFLEARLHVIFTAESIINGPASVFNMDDIKQLTNLFKLLRDINNQKKITITKQIFRMIILSLQEMFLKKRQLSYEIVGSFLREIIILCLNFSLPRLSLLQIVRRLADKYNKVERMFEQDNQGYGLNSFNEKVEDPSSSNSIFTSVIDILKDIQKKWNKNMLADEKQAIKKLLNKQFRTEKLISFEELLKREQQFFKN